LTEENGLGAVLETRGASRDSVSGRNYPRMTMLTWLRRMVQDVDFLQLLASGRHPPKVAMLTWLRRMIHSLIVLVMMTWLVMNGPDIVLCLWMCG